MKMQSIGFLVVMTFIMVSTTMAATSDRTATTEANSEKPQIYTLQYLSQITHGQAIHRIPVKAKSFEEALSLSRKQCVRDLMDRNFSNQEILNLCNNPRVL
ncbi:MAG: hypothetical protein ACK5V3_17615 [Bdellovibrionales bacterium]